MSTFPTAPTFPSRSMDQDTFNTAMDNLFAFLTSLSTWANAPGNLNPLGENRLINGGFSFNQRGLSGVTDANYAFDRWVTLTQTLSTVAPSRLTDPAIGVPFAARLTQSQSTPERLGQEQIVESVNCRDLRSAAVTFSGAARMSVAGNVRFAILEWTGTADSVTRDRVFDWTSTNYTGGNFFIAANVNILAVGSVAVTGGSSFVPFSLTATCGASMNNLIVFYWSESALAQTATIDVAKCKLEAGSTATAWQPRSTELELLLCQRYYRKSFPQGTAPAQAAGYGGAISKGGQDASASSDISFTTIQFGAPMFATPTVVTYNPHNADAQIVNSNSGVSWTNTAVFGAGPWGFGVRGTTNAGSQPSDQPNLHYTAEAEL